MIIDRGALGLDVNIEKVFLAQKMIIARCNLFGESESHMKLFDPI